MAKNHIPMLVRVYDGKLLTYLVDDRASEGDYVEVPANYFKDSGGGWVVQTHSEYKGELRLATWRQCWQESLRKQPEEVQPKEVAT